ncbi:hypothetical protein BJV82DRAFT_586788 [Fennellomyces sp. T-0311]|nr:hypothetical protein BJV82DRAFT_586788 [Fennellomyces sp. T-0311]
MEQLLNDNDSVDEQSTEDLLYRYLEPHLVQSDSPTLLPNLEFDTINDTLYQPSTVVPRHCVPGRYDGIQLQLSSFSDLQMALKDIGQDPYAIQDMTHLQLMGSPSLRSYASDSDDDKEDTTRKWSTEEDLVHLTSTELNVPSSIRLNVESSHMLDSLMQRAVSHWCCIGFKVAPISLDLIRDWHRAPPAIVYCVASISLVTFMDHGAGQTFTKQAAMVFYEQARHKMDDVFVEDMQPMIIQAYFCLSYTSNLLRLYEQQRTWGGLASIALQQHAKDIAQGRPIDRLTMMCWLRWYYVDAWMCLTLNRDCLLADDTPLSIANQVVDDDNEIPLENFDTLFQFAGLTHYMRLYIRAIQSGTIFEAGTTHPSEHYRVITDQLKEWYVQQHHTEIHFHLCYHAMRLVILFRFLHPTICPPKDILIDCLETNLALLQSLQHLKDIGCDQSTYHHMFFAINNTARRIYGYNSHSLRSFAEEQLRINLMLLRGTQAYINDVFKMRFYAEKIEQQFRELRISLDTAPSNIILSRASPTTHASPTNTSSPSNSTAPCIVVFRQKPLPPLSAPKLRKHASNRQQFSFAACSSKKSKCH